MQTPRVNVEIPAGIFRVTIQSMIPILSATKEIKVDGGVQNILIVSDREKWWDLLFVVDLVLWCADFLFHLPQPWDLVYDIFTNGYFVLWFLYEWLIRKRYFRLEYCQKPSPQEEAI